MPLQNRINPEGEICRSSAKGMLMGNRGCLHNDAKEIVARSKRDAWVTCLIEFNVGMSQAKSLHVIVGKPETRATFKDTR
jgi:hypothetical protein